MIDLQNEHVLPLRVAAKRLPRQRAGRKVHVSTLYRWAHDGLRGVRLETIYVGGTVCTSLEALQRFFDRLTAQRQQSTCERGQHPPQTGRRTLAQWERAQAQADRELSRDDI